MITTSRQARIATCCRTIANYCPPAAQFVFLCRQVRIAHLLSAVAREDAAALRRDLEAARSEVMGPFSGGGRFGCVAGGSCVGLMCWQLCPEGQYTRGHPRQKQACIFASPARRRIPRLFTSCCLSCIFLQLRPWSHTAVPTPTSSSCTCCRRLLTWQVRQQLAGL